MNESQMKRALITGITGQDGSYLTELLLSKGYEVHGVVRRTSSVARSRLDHLYSRPDIYNQRLFLHYADLDDPTPLRRILFKVHPDEVYHLAGQSHVGLSFEIPESTCELTAMGTLRLLEMLRDLSPAPRIFHASSSEIFGLPDATPQDENTPYRPATPYGCAKAFATQMVAVYRRAFGMFLCNGIMYNHESPRRGENFVSRKICRAAAAIKFGRQKELWLGDLDMKRDWGYAPDYVTAMWLMLQASQPDDYIIATGCQHSVRDIVEIAFAEAGLDWRKYVKQDARLMRPAEPQNLVGNAQKVRRQLNWSPTKPFEEMIREMTRAEIESLRG